MKPSYNLILLLIINFSILSCWAKEDSISQIAERELIQGYITNKIYRPIKLKIFQLDKNSLYEADENLDNNSYTPFVNLKLTAETTSDYSITEDNNNLFIPKATKLSGHISEIHSPRSFNRKGYFKIVFDKAQCPDGENIYLKSKLSSRSEIKTYNPLLHAGKTTLGLAGGALAGTLFSYQLGGLGLALSSHGYSLAIGAATGGFIGALGGLAAKGKDSSIEPGDNLVILPIDDVSLSELNQIVCKNTKTEEDIKEPVLENIKVEVISVKEKKSSFGESALKIKLKFTNNSDRTYKVSNFFLKDSQGNEYTISFTDTSSDLFLKFPPNETKDALIEFLVDHPKANHWLLLKDQDFNEILGTWKVKG